MLGPVAGLTIARFGARRNIIAGNIIAALGLLGMSQVQDVRQVYLFFGVMGGLGLAFAEFLTATTIVNSWFIRKKSLAMGLLLAAGGTGGFLMPVLISSLIAGQGWRVTWVCLAAIHLAASVLLAGLLIRDTPEGEGQLPDGDHRPNPAGFGAPNRVYFTEVDWSTRDALRTPALWILLLIFSVVLFAVNLLVTHQIAHLRDLHYSPMVSATALSLMLGMSIPGRLLAGVLGLRFDGRHLAAAFLVCMGMGMVSLLNAEQMIFVYLYSALCGLGFGGMIVLLPNMMGAYFGRTHFSRIVGWTTPVVTLASAVSPTLAGYLYDATGSYFLPFTLTAALLFGCVILVWQARPPSGYISK